MAATVAVSAPWKLCCAETLCEVFPVVGSELLCHAAALDAVLHSPQLRRVAPRLAGTSYARRGSFCGCVRGVRSSLRSWADVFFRAPVLRRGFISAARCKRGPLDVAWLSLCWCGRSSASSRPPSTRLQSGRDRRRLRSSSHHARLRASLFPSRFLVSRTQHYASQQCSWCVVCDGIDHSGTTLLYSFLTFLIFTFLSPILFPQLFPLPDCVKCRWAPMRA